MHSDSGPPGMKGPSASHHEECHHRDYCRDQPKKHVNQVHPYSVLHPLDTSVRGLRMNVDLSKDTEDGHPQYTDHELAGFHPTYYDYTLLGAHSQKDDIPAKGPPALHLGQDID